MIARNQSHDDQSNKGASVRDPCRLGLRPVPKIALADYRAQMPEGTKEDRRSERCEAGPVLFERNHPGDKRSGAKREQTDNDATDNGKRMGARQRFLELRFRRGVDKSIYRKIRRHLEECDEGRQYRSEADFPQG